VGGAAPEVEVAGVGLSSTSPRESHYSHRLRRLLHGGVIHR